MTIAEITGVHPVRSTSLVYLFRDATHANKGVSAKHTMMIVGASQGCEPKSRERTHRPHKEALQTHISGAIRSK